MRTILYLAVAALFATSLTACADDGGNPAPATQERSGLLVEEDPPATATQERSGPASAVGASWAYYYKDLASLHDAAELVVEGVVTELLGTKGGALTRPPLSSYYGFEVEQVLKGVPSDSVITLYQTGGTTDWGTQEITDDPLFVVGERYILFLRENEASYTVLGGPQGRFVVRDNQVSSLDSIYPERNIMLAKHLRVRDMPLAEFHAALPSPLADPGSN